MRNITQWGSDTVGVVDIRMWCEKQVLEEQVECLRGHEGRTGDLSSALEHERIPRVWAVRNGCRDLSGCQCLIH